MDKIPILSCSINYLRKHIHSFTDLSTTMGHAVKAIAQKVYRRLLFSVSANISGVFDSYNHSHGKCAHISTASFTHTHTHVYNINRCVYTVTHTV